MRITRKKKKLSFIEKNDLFLEKNKILLKEIRIVSFHKRTPLWV